MVASYADDGLAQTCPFVETGAYTTLALQASRPLDSAALAFYRRAAQARREPTLSHAADLTRRRTPENQASLVKSTDLFPLRTSQVSLLADYSADHPQWAAALKMLPGGKNAPRLASWRVVRTMLGDGFRDMFDTSRHPDLTEGRSR